MASIRERTSKSGEITFSVLYRYGNKQASTTVETREEAENLKALIDMFKPDRAFKMLAADESGEHQLTVDQLAERFLAWKADDVTERTMADYRRDYENWIQPYLGHRAAELVDEADVQEWVETMKRTKRLSPKSIADRHAILHQIYQYGKAKSRKLVTHNPCLETELPTRTKKPPKGTTVAEWKAIRRAGVERDNQDAADFVEFLGTLGWRFSEGAALCKDACEDDGDDLWVDVIRVFRIVANRQVLVDDAAKSYAGFRRARLPRACAAMVRRRLVGLGDSDFVFTNRLGNHWNQNTFLSTTWPTLVRAAAVGSPTRKPTPHWLRHMAVANMAKAGIPMHEIQRIIGHEDISTTNKTYGGMISTLSDVGLVNLDRVLEGRDPDIVVGEVVTSVVVTDPLELV